MQRRLVWLSSLIGLFAPGCSFVTDFDGYVFVDVDGGVGDGGGDDVAPPTVVGASPSGTLVDGRTPIVVTFSEPIEADAADVSVTLDTALPIAGSVAVSGATLTFTPSFPFTAVGTYEVEVGTGVADLAGNALAAPHVFAFTVPTQGNGGAVARRLDTVGTGGVSCPHLAMDAHGNAMVLFQQGTTLYTSYYRAGAGWEPTQPLAEGTDGVLSMSPEGRIAVAYTGTVAAAQRTLVRTAPGQGDPTFGAASLADEGSVHPVDTAGTCTLRAQTKNVAINDDGVVAVIWKVMTPTGGDPIVGWTHNVRAASGAWATAVFTANYPNDSWPDKPGIAIDPDGNVETVFRTFTGLDYAHAYRRYDAAMQAWRPLVTADTQGADYAPRIAMNSEGDFTFGLFVYDFGTSTTSLVIRSRAFDGTAALPVLTETLSMPPTDLWVSTSNGPWASFRTGSLTGVAGYYGSTWELHPSFLSDASAANPIIVGTSGAAATQARALMVYERSGEVRWSAVTQGMFGIDGAVPRVLQTGAAAAHDPRLAFDVPGQHGIVTWISDDPSGARIFATQFHTLPQSTP